MTSRTTRFETLLEAVPDALVGMDQKGVIRFVNRQTESLFGFDRTQLIGEPVETLVPEPLWQIYAQHRDDFFADPRTRSSGLELELSGRRRDGSDFPINVTLARIDTGDVLLAITAVSDVVKQKRAVKNAELMAAVVEYSDDAIMSGTFEGIITSWNPAAERLYGYASREIIGQSAKLLAPEDGTGEFAANLARARDGQVIEHFETVRVRKDGSRVPVSLTIAPIRDEDGAIVGFSVVHRDVTEQRRAAETVCPSDRPDEMTDILAKASLDPLVTISPEGMITDVNQAMVTVTGVPRDGLIGTDFSQYATKPAKARKGYRLAYEQGSVRDYPLTLRRRPDGALTDVLYNATVYRDLNGEVLGVFAAARDVTGQKEALRTAQHMAAIVEYSQDAIFSRTIDGIVTSWNPAAERMFGYSGAEMIGKPIDLLIPAEQAGEQISLLSKLSSGRPVENWETIRVRKDGTRFSVSLTLSPIRDDHGAIVGAAVICRDITAAKHAAQYARSLIEAALDPLVTISPEGKVTDVNEATVKVTGVPRKKLIGSDFCRYFTDPDQAHAGYERAFAQGSVTDYPLTLRHRDGTLTDVLYNASVYRDTGGNVLGVFAAAREVTRAHTDGH